MRDKFHHRGHRGRAREAGRFSPCSQRLCVLCVKTSFVLTLIGLFALAATAQTQTRQPLPPEKRIRYQINLALDYEDRSYTGTERVRWINRGEHPTSTLYFHLYPNVRVPGYVPPTEKTSTGQTVADEPRLEIAEVRNAADNSRLVFALDDQETTLRVQLREALAPNASIEVAIKFKGSVPEIDPEETGLVTHVLQQVSAAIRSTREIRRARDINFRCRGVLMLGTAFPVLAARDGDDWFRKIESNIGDALTTDTADYEVTVIAPREVAVYTPAPAKTATPDEKMTSSSFVAENLRDFAIVAGNNLRSEERQVGELTVRSIYRPDHETAGRRVLNIAAEAVQIGRAHV